MHPLFIFGFAKVGVAIFLKKFLGKVLLLYDDL